MKSPAADPATDLERNISAYSEADELHRAGEFQEALRLFEVASDADPSDGDAFHAIGSCYDALGKPARAAMAYRAAIKLLPPDRHPELHFNIGNAFFDLEKYAEAIEQYQRVPRESSVWPAAYRNSRLAHEKGRNGS